MPASVHTILVHGALFSEGGGVILLTGKLPEESQESRIKKLSYLRRSHSRKISRSSTEML